MIKNDFLLFKDYLTKNKLLSSIRSHLIWLVVNVSDCHARHLWILELFIVGGLFVCLCSVMHTRGLHRSIRFQVTKIQATKFGGFQIVFNNE